MITEIVAQSSDRLCQIYPDSHAAYTSSSKFCDFYQDEMAPQAKIPKKKIIRGWLQLGSHKYISQFIDQRLNETTNTRKASKH